MATDKGEIVSTEVSLNAAYGYHVGAELVGCEGTASLAPHAVSLLSHNGRHGHGYPDIWIRRFATAYRDQMQAWVRSLSTGKPVGASAWDGYCVTAIAEQLAEGMGRGDLRLTLPGRPALYANAR